MPSSADPAAMPAALRARVRAAVEQAWADAVAGGHLPAVEDGAAVPIVEIERPANAAFGDFATNLAMKLARPLRRSPLEIAEALAASLRVGPATALIASAEVVRPGFLNLRLTDVALEGVVGGILAAPAAWGRIPAVNPRRVNVEFVSANPTGPLTVGNARGAFVGDLLCRVLEAGGQIVTREYYFNDSGTQIEHLGASVVAARRGEPVPEDGYKGAYVEDLARAVPDDVWAAASAPGADAADVVGRWAATRVRAMIEASLVRLGVRFDVWKTEASLHDEGWVARAVDRLRAAGHVYEQDGALWFRSTTFGDDKDRVIYRSDGRPTYFAADIGYVTEKFSRGFDHLIYIWGVDHHGTVARNQNAAEAMGYDARALPGAAHRVGPVRGRRRRGLDVQAGRDLRDPGRPAGRGGHGRGTLVLRLARGARGDRLRHRAGAEAVGREPRLLRAVRPRPDRVDPAQGGGGGAGAGVRCRRAAGRRAGGRPGPRGGPVPGGAGGRGPGRGDAGHHGVRHGARDAVPRVLPGRTGGGHDASRSGPRSGWRWRWPRGPRWRTRSALLGISAPESM